MKEKIINVLRWIAVLPASVIGSVLVFYLYSFLNHSQGYLHTNFDSIWDCIITFVASAFMGCAFVVIGHYVAPSYQKMCSFVLFAIVCILAGIFLFANIVVGFSWVNLVNVICMVGGAGYAYMVVQDE